MKSNLVHVVKSDILTSTVIISDLLEIPHRDLLRTVERIINRQESQDNAQRSRLKFPQKFIKSSFKNKMNRTYTMYELNEQAYLKLAMHLKGYEKAEIVQDAIIEAFSLIKQALLNQSNQSWLKSRNDSKTIRLKETDVIKDFVDYATKQGSKSASKYYMNITKMTNKSLELLVQIKSGTQLRNLASIMELGFIQILDNRAMQAIEYGMSENMYYKDIYQYAKEEVNKLADNLNFKALKK